MFFRLFEVLLIFEASFLSTFFFEPLDFKVVLGISDWGSYHLCVNVGNLRLFRHVSTLTPILASFDNNCYRLWQRRRMTHVTLTRSMRLLQLVESCVHKLGVWWLNYVLILINKRIQDSSLKMASFKSHDLKYVFPWFYLNWTSHLLFFLIIWVNTVKSWIQLKWFLFSLN